jgi:hypothetical protein
MPWLRVSLLSKGRRQVEDTKGCYQKKDNAGGAVAHS